MSSIVPPAASTAAFTFSQTWRVCSVMSPMPAMLPSGRRAVMPDTNTKRPVASIAVACEKTPFGWRSLGVAIWVLAMMFFLHRCVERHCSDAKFKREARQHRDDRGLKLNVAAGALAPLPFRLARREKLLHAGSAASGADMLRSGGAMLAKPRDIAEMRDVDRNKEMRTVVPHGDVPLEGTPLRPGRALPHHPPHA